MENKEILCQAQHIAVIGVTQNHDKYGYKIYQKLKEMQKHVYGVSPIYNEIEGDKTYPSILDIPEAIDMAVFVVNPKLGSEYVKQCHDKHVPLIWLQPSTYDDQLLSEIEKANIQSIQACVLVEADK